MRIPDSAPVRRVFLIVSTLILTSPLFAAVPFNVGDVFAAASTSPFAKQRSS